MGWITKSSSISECVDDNSTGQALSAQAQHHEVHWSCIDGAALWFWYMALCMPFMRSNSADDKDWL